MLQQTQVSRVVDRFLAFVAKFPDVHALAGATEADVLSMWGGLGYYRRARNLHSAAREIVNRFNGSVPHDVHDLLTLPGVGRYTAGAVASIVFDQRVPLVDGNVARVLLRVCARATRPDDKVTQSWLWNRAAEVVNAQGVSAALINEGLMELGATVCLPAPATPRCDECPLKNVCRARAQGNQKQIPAPETRRPRKQVFCATIILQDSSGRVLVEQRGGPARQGRAGAGAGMWAGLWQLPTLERDDRSPIESEVVEFIGLKPGRIHLVQSFEFLATHRRMSFDVWRVRTPLKAREISKARATREFVDVSAALSRGVSSPQRRALAIAVRAGATAFTE